MQRETCLFIALSLAGCSSESGDDAASQPSTDAGVETSTTEDGGGDVATEDGSAKTFGIPFCTELGVDNVLPYTVVITNDFAKKVVSDCRVLKLLLTMGPDEGTAWTAKTTTWTGAFFGCPGSGGRVESFGPVETGQSPAVSQSDIDVLVEHFASATEQSLTLSTAQSQALRDELAAVGSLAVNVPTAENALGLCTDAGVNDAGGDAGDAEDGGSDADPADGEAGP